MEEKVVENERQKKNKEKTLEIKIKEWIKSVKQKDGQKKPEIEKKEEMHVP